MSMEVTSNKEISGQELSIIQILLWSIIFIKVLISPEILFGLPHLNEKPNYHPDPVLKYESWKISNIEIQNLQDVKLKDKVDFKIIQLIDEIEHLTKNQHYFRNQKITIMDMANELNVPVSHLVYMFKYHCKFTFTEYKTIIKIEDAKLLIESGFLRINTLESLAMEVGFSSYNPFFTAFKKLVGKSPNEYANSISKN